MVRTRNLILFILITLILLFPLVRPGAAQEPVIRAVLFYSPSCPHCLDVINSILPPLVDQYGTQLQIFGVNTYTEEGHRLFSNAVEVYAIPEERQAVPTLLIGQHALLGSGEIPDLLPGIIQQGLEEGGIDWPPITGLKEAMQETESGEGESTANLEHKMTLGEKFASDLLGNIFSVVVLIGMLGTVAYVGFGLKKNQPQKQTQFPNWLFPILSVIGLGVAGYLAYVEFTQVEAVCGPVGNCNTVQQSTYATLFGVIPIGFLGVLGYLGILILWLLETLEIPIWQKRIKAALWVIALFGTLFSIYLTFLEPFVIGATCMWCLTSAVIMTFLFFLATKRVNQAELVVSEES